MSNNTHDYYRMVNNSESIELHEIILSGAAAIKPQTLSIKAMLTNGFYPRRYLSNRMLLLESAGLSITSHNISRPTDYYPRCHSQQELSKVIGKFSHNYQSLFRKQTLIDVLIGYDLKQAYTKKINAILNTQYLCKPTIQKGIIFHSIIFQIDIDDSCFSSTEELYLWGMMLHYLLMQFIDLNYFYTTELKTLHQKKIYSWSSAHGKLQRNGCKFT